MAQTYEIKIFNHSNTDHSYFLFQEAPETGAKQVFTNTYAESPEIQSGKQSSTTFRVLRKFFAVCGVQGGAFKDGVTVSSITPADVKLGSKDIESTNTLMTTSNNSPKWITPSAILAPNAFGIKTDGSFKLPLPPTKNIFIGLGALDPNDPESVVATAVFSAEPSVQYTVEPKVKFYVCTGSYQQGKIVNLKMIGNPLIINFDEEDLDAVAFNHLPNGEYERRSSFY